MRVAPEMEGHLEEENWQDLVIDYGLDLIIDSDQSLPDLRSLLDDDDSLQSILDTIDLDDMTCPVNMGEQPASISPRATNFYYNDDISRASHSLQSMPYPPQYHIPSIRSDLIFPPRTPNPNPFTLYTAQEASCHQASRQTPIVLPESRKRAASFSFGEAEPASHFRDAKLVTASSFQTIRGEAFVSRDNHSPPERVPPVQEVETSSFTLSRNPMLTSAVQKEKGEGWQSDKQPDLQASAYRKEGSIQRQSSTGREEEKKTEVSTSSSSKPAGKRKKVMLDDFLLELLKDKKYIAYIQWTSEERGEFKFTKPEMVAKLWGDFKKKKLMNYEKLSRGLRYYYTSARIERIQHKHYHFRFLQKNSGN